MSTRENPSLLLACRGCPGIVALDTGDCAVIGIDITAQAQGHLPPTVGCGPDERVVWLPRATLVRAKPDIPDRE